MQGRSGAIHFSQLSESRQPRPLPREWLNPSPPHVLFEMVPISDFPREFEALEQEELLRINDQTIEPTARGMFYADSIAGLLAWGQVLDRRNDTLFVNDVANSNGVGYL